MGVDSILASETPVLGDSAVTRQLWQNLTARPSGVVLQYVAGRWKRSQTRAPSPLTKVRSFRSKGSLQVGFSYVSDQRSLGTMAADRNSSPPSPTSMKPITPTFPLTRSRPATLGIWRLGERLHTGTATEVTLAQPADARHSPRWDYVIKRAIDPDSHPEHRREIVQFTAATAEAKHPNLVPVLDGSPTGPTPYIVMPRLEGRTMQSHLEDPEPKPLPVALWFVRQTSQALAALHAAGWVHGDVKPSNVIIGTRGHVTLIDLSFAAREHTLPGHSFRGTPEYAAPEKCAGDVAAMPSMDMFAVGRMLWQWMAASQTVSQQVLEPIAELVEQLVSVNPNTRPTAMQVVQQSLRLEIETLGHHIVPSHPPRRSRAA